MIMSTMVFSASALTSESILLSELSDVECIAFIKDRGVVIPEAYEDEMDSVEFARYVITRVEEDPEAVFSFGYQFLTDFANEIKAVVNDYYQTSQTTGYAYRGSLENILEDNIVVGTWKAEYEDYNCYAYAIGYDTWIHPGQIEWMNMGNDYETYMYNLNANIFTIAGWVQDDLESLGYSVDSPTTAMPDVSVSEHNHLICVRKDEDTTLDFHLMVLKTDGAWYHKPGDTNPLKYKYTPTSGRVWVLEGYNGAIYSRDEDVTYDSTIYYIKYTTPHEYEYEPCGSNQHIRTCTICGDTSGSAISCVYSNNVCRICGGSKPIDLTPNKFGGVLLEE